MATLTLDQRLLLNPVVHYGSSSGWTCPCIEVSCGLLLDLFLLLPLTSGAAEARICA
jgi:hypothetical protein